MEKAFIKLSLSTDKLAEVENMVQGIGHAVNKLNVTMTADARELNAALSMAKNIVEQIWFIQGCIKTEKEWKALTQDNKANITQWEAQC